MKRELKKIFKIGDPNPLHPDKKLESRRDFLATGLKAFSASVMLPSVIDLVLNDKIAQAAGTAACETGSTMAGTIPFLIFDCAGGASLPGNWVMTDQEGKNGQMLPSYSKLGLSDQNSFVADNRFGAPMAAPLLINPDLMSQIYGQLMNDDFFMNDNTTQAVKDDLKAALIAMRSCLKMGIICHTSLSDSQTNTLSAVSLITAAGFQGSRIKNGLGMRASPSAGNSDAASLNPAYRPMGVSDVESLNTALSYGPAFNSLPQKAKDALAKALGKLSASQATQLSSMRLGDQFSTLVQCGLLKNTEFTGNSGSVDGRTDPVMQVTYAINAGTASTSGAAVVATLVKNALDGTSGPGVITIGGCDYHTGDRTTGDNKDREIGANIVRALVSAYKKGKKVAFQIFTDGGIYSDDGTRNWRGDDNDKSLTVFGIMDPAGAHEMVSYQLGRYTAGQGADRNHFLGTDTTRVAHTVLLNYLAVCGQVGRYADIAKDNPLPKDKLDSLLLFANKA